MKTHRDELVSTATEVLLGYLQEKFPNEPIEPEKIRGMAERIVDQFIPEYLDQLLAGREQQKGI